MKVLQLFLAGGIYQWLHYIVLLMLWLGGYGYARESQAQNSSDEPCRDHFEKLTVAAVITDLESLEQELKAYFIQYAAAQSQAINYKEKGKVLKYLPSVGYNFVTQTPQFCYNTGAIYRALNEKQIKAARIKEIKRGVESTYQKVLARLHKNYRDLQAEIECYNDAVEVYQMHLAVFQIKQGQYEELAIGPLEYLHWQIKMKGQQMSLKEKYVKVFKRRDLIVDIAKAVGKPGLFE